MSWSLDIFLSINFDTSGCTDIGIRKFAVWEKCCSHYSFALHPTRDVTHEWDILYNNMLLKGHSLHIVFGTETKVFSTYYLMKPKYSAHIVYWNQGIQHKLFNETIVYRTYCLLKPGYSAHIVYWNQDSTYCLLKPEYTAHIIYWNQSIPHIFFKETRIFSAYCLLKPEYWAHIVY